MRSRTAIIAVAAAILLAPSASATGQYFQCAHVYSDQASAEPAPKVVVPSHGVQHALIIFARFLDQPEVGDSAPSYAPELLDPTLPGSLAHFYLDMSEGQLILKGQALSRVYASSHKGSWYEDVRSFSQEILQSVDADTSVRFSDFDNDGPDGIPNSGDDDGQVDLVFLNILGKLPPGFLTGTATGMASLGGCYTTRERRNPSGWITVWQGTVQRVWGFAHAVGSMAHEFGHILGLPDLYDTDSVLREGHIPPDEDSAGIGNWCLMGRGALGWSDTDGPNSFCAWSRMKLGWLGNDNERIVKVSSALLDAVIGDVNADGNVYKIPVSSDEYFLIENRQASGSYYDRNIPQSGLLIWHVDESAWDNNDEMHKLLDLECADGLYDDKGYPWGSVPNPRNGRDNLDFWASPFYFPGHAEAYGGNLGDATDVFDGVRYTHFDPQTNPSSIGTDGSPTDVQVASIRRSGTDIIVDILRNYWSGPICSEFPESGFPAGVVRWRGNVTVGGDVTVLPGALLMIEPGTTVRVHTSDRAAGGLDPHKLEIMVQGSIRTARTSMDRVLFTSAADVPLPGDWCGIRVSGPSASLRLDHAVVEYAECGIAGAQSGGDIALTNTTLQRNLRAAVDLEDWTGGVILHESCVRDNGSAGVLMLGGGTLLVENTIFEANGGFGVQFGGAGLRAVGSRFVGHQVALALSVTVTPSPYAVERCAFVHNEHAIQNDGSPELRAEYNWWGTADPASVSASITGPVDWLPLLCSDPQDHQAFLLEPSSPNPFKSATSFRFVLPGVPGVDAASARVTLVVTDLLGREVRTLVDDALYPGAHYALWDGTDDAGRKMACGVYFWSISAPGYNATGRMVMVH